MVDYAQLKKFDRGVLDDLAAKWKSQAENLREQADEVAKQRKSLGDWEGAAGEAAGGVLAKLGSKLDDSAEEMGKIPSKITDAAEVIDKARKELDNAVEDVPKGASVKDDGTVSLEAGGIDSGYTEEAPDPVEAGKVQGRIKDALKRATEADEDASAAVRKHLPKEIGVDVEDISTPDVKGKTPEQIANWWSDASPMERRMLVFHNSDEVGNLDGIPVTARDQANRFVLDEHKQILQTRTDYDSPSDTEYSLADKKNSLRDIEDKLYGDGPDIKGDSKDDVYLMGFDAQGNAHDGRAAIAFGNPDELDNVATTVPGMGSGLGADSLGGDLHKAEQLRGEAGGDTASIVWEGYDAPQSGDAGSPVAADQATDDLNQFQRGLENRNPDAHTSVFGHSYGSTVVGHAAQDAADSGSKFAAADVAFVGSPGVGVDHAKDLGVDPDHVWAGRADNDVIQHVTGTAHGSDPTDQEFGANTFSADPGSGAHQVETHSDYWGSGNRSLENMGEIAAGKGDDVDPQTLNPDPPPVRPAPPPWNWTE